MAATTAAAIAGCQPARWERPDTDQAVQEADIRACRGAAHRGYRALTAQPLFLPYFVTVRDNKGRTRSVPVVPSQQFGPPVWLPYAPQLALDQLSWRDDLFKQCLQAKGYSRVPDEGDS